MSQLLRQSSIITYHDRSGSYEVERFDHPHPKNMIVCVHGNGVRRWDGERFFYAVAEHFSDSVVVLVDQTQPEGDGARLNPLPVMVERVETARREAVKLHPTVPVIVIAHSMGCGVSTFLDTSGISAVIFVAPTAGNAEQKLIQRYGPDISKGRVIKTSDGLIKHITAGFYESVRGIVWEDEYRKFVARFQPIYVFAAGNEEIVGEERLAHRDIPFTRYQIIPRARHNFAGAPLADLLARLDLLPELIADI